MTTDATTISEGPKMTIDGRSVGSAAVIEVANPALGEVSWTVPDCSLDQLDAAVAGAAGAFPAWAARPVEERQGVLLKMISRVEDYRTELAELLTREQGKPLANATSEINSALGDRRAYAEMSLPPEVLLDDEGNYVELRRVPLGWSRPSRPGTNPCCCRCGRSPRRSWPATRWWSSRLLSRRSRRCVWASCWQMCCLRASCRSSAAGTK